MKKENKNQNNLFCSQNNYKSKKQNNYKNFKFNNNSFKNFKFNIKIFLKKRIKIYN